MTFLEDIIDEELGATKVGKKIRKGLKAVATGGMSLAVDKAKKTKLGRKALRVAKAIGTGGASLAFEKKGKKKISALSKKVKSALSAKKAKAVVAKVQAKKAGDCKCNSDLVKLVSGKLVAELGPPLTKANQILAKFDLQRKATYEHQKLMRDAEFRRKVLSFIAQKANQGNVSCKRTISALKVF